MNKKIATLLFAIGFGAADGKTCLRDMCGYDY